MTEIGFTELTVIISAVLIFFSIVFGIVRLVIGPDTVDRVVAIDLLTIVTIALIALLAHQAERYIYLDVGLVYGLLSFLGVLAVARYLEGGLCAGILLSALLAVILKNNVGAIVSAGLASLFASVVYVVLAAPDVAMTEASIGSGLTTMIFLYAIRKTQGIDTTSRENK
jgi:multicomponent Na+:H+ antiporter subunit F